MSGWIKLHRRFKEWEWYSSSDTVHLFIHLLTSANHKPKRWKGVDLKRGQVLVGRKKLSEQLGISEQRIKTILKRLKSTSEITTQSTNRYTIVTICNYDTYQLEESKNNQQSNQPTHQQATSNQPLHKKEKKEKKKEQRDIYISMFNEVTGKSMRVLNDKTYNQIKTRLKDGYTFDDIKTALKNACADSYHISENLKYITLEFITRTNKLERYVSQSATGDTMSRDDRRAEYIINSAMAAKTGGTNAG